MPTVELGGERARNEPLPCKDRCLRKQGPVLVLVLSSARASTPRRPSRSLPKVMLRAVPPRTRSWTSWLHPSVLSHCWRQAAKHLPAASPSKRPTGRSTLSLSACGRFPAREIAAACHIRSSPEFGALVGCHASYRFDPDRHSHRAILAPTPVVSTTRSCSRSQIASPGSTAG